MLVFFCDLYNMSHSRDKLEPSVQLTPRGAGWKEASLRLGPALPRPLRGEETGNQGLCLPVRSLGR